jgi:metallo-beta-lactamase class B
MSKIYSVYLPVLILAIAGFYHANAQYGTNKVSKISDDLEVLMISDNVYIHISYLAAPDGRRYPCNGLVYINDKEAFIIDTPVNDQLTLELINWIKNELGAEIEGVIVNHWHVDCMGGLNQVHMSGIKSYAHELTCEIAAAKNLPVPGFCFGDSLIIKTGQKEILCKYFGPAHTVDNIVVWIPEDEILFGGCMVRALSASTPGNITDADLNSWPETMKKVIRRFGHARIVVPGHGSYGGPELLTHTLDLVRQ